MLRTVGNSISSVTSGISSLSTSIYQFVTRKPSNPENEIEIAIKNFNTARDNLIKTDTPLL